MKTEWPKHPDGRNKKIREMTTAEQDRVAHDAIERLKPEFAREGINLEYRGIYEKCGFCGKHHLPSACLDH